ncbi:MAG: hypothetical protein ACRDHO_02730 [Actinomycetota bacterium]
MKKVAIVLLILVLLLVALPLGMSMAMGVCPDSHLSSCPVGIGMCLAFMGLLTLGLPLLLVSVRQDSTSRADLLLVRSIEHPPRLS